MDGGGCVVTSVGDVLQENGVEWGAPKGSNGVWNSGAGSLDGDIVVLFEIDTGVLLGRVVGFTKELLLQTNAAPAYDVVSIPPSTVTGRWFAPSTAVLLLRTTPAAGRLGPVRTPPVAAFVGGDMATARASVLERWFRKGVVTTKRGCGRAGVVPAVPRKGKVRLMGGARDDAVLTRWREEREWRQPAAGFSYEGGRKRFFRRLCPERLRVRKGVRRAQCQLEGVDAPNGLSSEADPFTGPFVILSEYF